MVYSTLYTNQHTYTFLIHNDRSNNGQIHIVKVQILSVSKDNNDGGGGDDNGGGCGSNYGDDDY